MKTGIAENHQGEEAVADPLFVATNVATKESVPEAYKPLSCWPLAGLVH